jgi:hypothetical protein
VVHHYVVTTGDSDLLNEVVPFIASPILTEEREEDFNLPALSEQTGTVYGLCPKSSPCRDLKSSLRPLRISVISALNNYREYSYAEITEIRRDRREELVNCKNHFSGKAPFMNTAFAR